MEPEGLHYTTQISHQRGSYARKWINKLYIKLLMFTSFNPAVCFETFEDRRSCVHS